MKRLTKSQYEAIAWTIKDVYDYQKDSDGPGSKKIKQAAIEVVASNLAIDFASVDNEFDRKKFLALCGITD